MRRSHSPETSKGFNLLSPQFVDLNSEHERRAEEALAELFEQLVRRDSDGLTPPLDQRSARPQPTGEEP
jgi:hypothetical protein